VYEGGGAGVADVGRRRRRRHHHHRSTLFSLCIRSGRAGRRWRLFFIPSWQRNGRGRAALPPLFGPLLSYHCGGVLFVASRLAELRQFFSIRHARVDVKGSLGAGLARFFVEQYVLLFPRRHSCARFLAEKILSTSILDGTFGNQSVSQSHALGYFPILFLFGHFTRGA